MAQTRVYAKATSLLFHIAEQHLEKGQRVLHRPIPKGDGAGSLGFIPLPFL